MADDKTLFAKVEKVDEELGLVMGFAIVCEDNGQPYFDVQGDHIPEGAMLKAALDFMQNSRTAKEMHQGGEAGSVVFAWPMTKAVAKAFNVTTPRTGLMIAMRPGSEAMLSKFRSGEYGGFSIGGVRVRDEDVSNA